MIDTLQLAKDLEKDFPPAQAEALTRALSHVLAEELATKADLEAVKAELKALSTDVNALGADLRAEMARLAMKLMGEINDVRGEIKDLKVDTVRWIVGALLVNFFGVAGLMITLRKVIH